MPIILYYSSPLFEQTFDVRWLLALTQRTHRSMSYSSVNVLLAGHWTTTEGVCQHMGCTVGEAELPILSQGASCESHLHRVRDRCYAGIVSFCDSDAYTHLACNQSIFSWYRNLCRMETYVWFQLSLLTLVNPVLIMLAYSHCVLVVSSNFRRYSGRRLRLKSRGPPELLVWESLFRTFLSPLGSAGCLLVFPNTTWIASAW